VIPGKLLRADRQGGPGLGEQVAGAVIAGRWQTEPGSRGPGAANIGAVHQLDVSPPARGLLELHPAPDRAAAEAAAGAVRQSATVTSGSLLAVLDCGVIPPEPGPAARVFVVTGLWDRLPPDGPADERSLREVALAAARGLAALHRAGIHHGGLHRESVRHSAGGWKLAPAGLSALVQTETAPYRPPGLHVMEPPSPAADIWNLGVILHELGTGRLLRPGETPTVTGAPVIDHLVRSALQANPADRPSAQAVIDLLESTPLGHRPPAGPAHPAQPASPGTTSEEPTESRPTAMGRRDRSQLSDPAARSSPGSGPPARSGGHGLVGGTGSRPILAAALAAFAVVVAAVAMIAWQSGDGGDSTEAGGSGGQTATGPTTSTSTGGSGADPVAAQPSGERQDGVALSGLTAGWCGDLGLGQGVVASAQARDCDEAHEAEVTAVLPLDQGDPGAAYPGRRQLETLTGDSCDDEFARYVGADVLTTVLASHDLLPTAGEWQDGSRRSVLCLATRYDGGALERTVAGAATRFRLTEGQPTSIGKLLPGMCFDQETATLAATGARQGVTVTGCLNPHSFEVFHRAPLTLDPGEVEVLTMPQPERYGQLTEAAAAGCAAFWEGLSVPVTSTEPRILAVSPDAYDWQLGDRTYQCVVQWPEPALSSVVIDTAIAAGGTGTNSSIGG
jgi:hypothetical protein